MKKLILSLAAVVLSCGAMMAGNNILGILNVGGRIGIVSSSEQVPNTGDGVMDKIEEVLCEEADFAEAE